MEQIVALMANDGGWLDGCGIVRERGGKPIIASDWLLMQT